ncbi:thiamine phosphate synthase [Paraglaciecola chathamensis]|uniref:hydroxymethylpyrimidine kinase n=1 Tax=Paraglaciecola chathamensis TaxID=368405 RepID=A0ABS0WCB9_9ALTE|nr:thiamine phosphate synthase [Paraglaciecola chathamensis]MBJ2136103.1 thiamine phosphate synthase [Paraglaciecola chathamensis]
MIDRDALVSDTQSTDHGIKPTVLTFSGSDSAGLAGMQMDIKVQHAFNIHCLSVLTAVTAQNNQQVLAMHAVEQTMFDAQIKAISAFKPGAIKTGLITQHAQAKSIIDAKQALGIPLICDPVGAATSGNSLIAKGSEDSDGHYTDVLLPHCTLITPNIPEAERLVGFSILSSQDIKNAAKILLDKGASTVLIKGGHGPCAKRFSQDYYCSPTEQFWLENQWIDTQHTRGTGCALASAIASCIALGYCLKDAVVIAKMAITQGLIDAKGLLSNPQGYIQGYMDTHDKGVKNCEDTHAKQSYMDTHNKGGVEENYKDTHDKGAESYEDTHGKGTGNYKDTHDKGAVDIRSFPSAQLSLPSLRDGNGGAGCVEPHSFLAPVEPFPDIGDSPLGLYPIVDRADWLETLLPLGVTTIQLRIKDLLDRRLEDEISRAVQIARRYSCRLFINDHWQLAIKHRAYGVHLGQEDLIATQSDASNPIQQLRSAGLRLGISTHCHYEVARAHSFKPSYIAYGPVFATSSKDMPWVPQGLTGLDYWQNLLAYPLVAIGGINLERAQAIHALGVSGIAMISEITQADSPLEKTRALLAALRT